MRSVNPFAIAVLLLAGLFAPTGLASAAERIDVKMRYADGAEMINRMLGEDGFWGDADQNAYEDQLYDEIRLKKMDDGGFLPMITGEGDEDIPGDVVADIVFGQQTALPAYMEGAVSVTTMGYGMDPTFGVPYLDNYFILDMNFFYISYRQRMYRKKVGNTTYLWFEKMDETFVDAATWAKYNKTIEDTVGGLKLRRMFGSVIEVGQIYGIFVVEKGKARQSRVTFVSKIAFGDDAGWLAKFGSKLKPVLRAGLQSGFDASVKIAKAERDRRTK